MKFTFSYKFRNNNDSSDGSSIAIPVSELGTQINSLNKKGARYSTKDITFFFLESKIDKETRNQIKEALPGFDVVIVDGTEVPQIELWVSEK